MKKIKVTFIYVYYGSDMAFVLSMWNFTLCSPSLCVRNYRFIFHTRKFRSEHFYDLFKVTEGKFVQETIINQEFKSKFLKF